MISNTNSQPLFACISSIVVLAAISFTTPVIAKQSEDDENHSRPVINEQQQQQDVDDFQAKTSQLIEFSQTINQTIGQQQQLNDGTTENNSQSIEQVPLYMQHMTVILVSLHFSVFITGLIGNSLVCLSVLRNKSLQTVTNYYIVNLAVADFLVILICLPPTVYWDLTLTWNFGLILCKLVLYLQSISVSVSVLTLTCISVDRWYAICRPLEFSSTKYRAKITIVLIWILSMLIASPDAIFLTTRPLYEEGDKIYMDCTYNWDESNTKIYQLCIVTLLFFGPFVLMSISYYHIVEVLWHNEAFQRDKESCSMDFANQSAFSMVSPTNNNDNNNTNTTINNNINDIIIDKCDATNFESMARADGSHRGDNKKEPDLKQMATGNEETTTKGECLVSSLRTELSENDAAKGGTSFIRNENNRLDQSSGTTTTTTTIVAATSPDPIQQQQQLIQTGLRTDLKQPSDEIEASKSLSSPALNEIDGISSFSTYKCRLGREGAQLRKDKTLMASASGKGKGSNPNKGPKEKLVDHRQRSDALGLDHDLSCRKLGPRDTKRSTAMRAGATIRGDSELNEEEESKEVGQSNCCCCGFQASGLNSKSTGASKPEVGVDTEPAASSGCRCFKLRLVTLNLANGPREAAAATNPQAKDKTSKRYRKNLANYAARRDKHRLVSSVGPKPTNKRGSNRVDLVEACSIGTESATNELGRRNTKVHKLKQEQEQELNHNQHQQSHNYLSSSSSNNARFYKLIESRKKAAKMLIVVVIMFGLCYLPIHFLNTLRYTIGLPQNDIITIASLVSHWLCYFNSAINPLIYNLMSGKFRHEFANLFFCRCFRRNNAN